MSVSELRKLCIMKKLKKIIHKLLFKLLNKRYRRFGGLPRPACSVVIGDDGFMYVTDTNGVKLPYQTKLTLIDNINTDHPRVTVTMLVNIGIDNTKEDESK
jgi:hypothetical protein